MPNTCRFRTLVASLLIAATLHVAPRAQCVERWYPDRTVEGANDDVWESVLWDPDGVGGLTELVVIAGAFDGVGEVQVTQLAAFDPSIGEWQAVAPELDTVPQVLLPMPNGDLLAAGTFTATAAGAQLQAIARWDGSVWHDVGGGITGATGAVVRDLVLLPTGDVIATGSFDTAGGVAVNNIARWDGSSWHALGAGIDFGGGEDLAVAPNGDVVVSGLFQNAGNQPAINLARWDGSAWSAVLPNGLPTVTDIATLANGDLVIAGTGGLFQWNGSSLGVIEALPPTDSIEEVVVAPNGDVLIVGDFFWIDGMVARNVARWDGGAWHAFGVGADDTVRSATALPSGDLLVGGDFGSIGSATAVGVAIWDGMAWQATTFVGSGVVRALLEDPAGGLLIARSRQQNGVVTSSIYSDQGPPVLNQANGFVQGMEWGPGGDLYIVGSFTVVDGVAAVGVARHDGTTWHDVGGGVQGGTQIVGAITRMPNGDIVIGGSFNVVGGASAQHVARWDGQAWSSTGNIAHGASALAVLPNGILVAAGSLNGTMRVSRLLNGFWQSIGANFTASAALAMTVSSTGDLYLGGAFASIGTTGSPSIVRWDGSQWWAVGTGLTGPVGVTGVRTLEVLSNGDIIAAGNFEFAGGLPADNIARWDGQVWHAMQGGVGGTTPDVFAIERLANDQLAVGGTFTVADGQPANNFARWSPCAPSVTSYGTACAGPAGAMQLLPLSEPSLGAAFVSEALGFTQTSFGLWGVGLTQSSVSLAAVHPAGLPGCQLLAALDYSVVVVPSGGRAAESITIPINGTLLGLKLYNQVIQFDLPLAPGAFSISSSDALELTIGA